MHPWQEQLRNAVEQCIQGTSVQLLEMNVRGERGGRVIEVFVDGEAPVTADLCSELSRKIAAQLEIAGIIEGSYRLDVSSPGIDRPLRFPWQYAKHVGRRLRLTVRTDEVPRQVEGKLAGVDEAGVELETGKGGLVERVVFVDIVEATVMLPW